MKALLLTMLLSQGADLATTHIGLARGCHEGNQAFGARAPLTRIYVAKGTSMAVQGSIAWGAQKSGHPTVATVVLWTGIGLGVGAATWNTRQITKGCEVTR
jgi:hypothetical protein